MVNNKGVHVSDLINEIFDSNGHRQVFIPLLKERYTVKIMDEKKEKMKAEEFLNYLVNVEINLENAKKYVDEMISKYRYSGDRKEFEKWVLIKDVLERTGFSLRDVLIYEKYNEVATNLEGTEELLGKAKTIIGIITDKISDPERKSVLENVAKDIDKLEIEIGKIKEKLEFAVKDEHPSMLKFKLKKFKEKISNFFSQ